MCIFSRTYEFRDSKTIIAFIYQIPHKHENDEELELGTTLLSNPYA